MEISFTTLAQEQEQVAINICGTPCIGDCQTCVQSNADLNAFYGLASPAEESIPIAAVALDIPEEPVEVQVMAPTGDEEDETLEIARARDALEEAQRPGEVYDEEDEYDRYGCHCLDCLNHDDDNYRPSYYDEYEDSGYGLDWNESGYFD
jgi:hypothetical protein